MHELGIMFNVVRTVEAFARENNVTQINTLVLQVGELSPVVSHYIEACYPAAVEDTLLQDTQLKIEVTPGNVLCKNCNKVYNLIEQKGVCPKCAGREYDILSGKEFLIKEIVAC